MAVTVVEGVGLTGGVVSIPLSSIIFSVLCVSAQRTAERGKHECVHLVQIISQIHLDPQHHHIATQLFYIKDILTDIIITCKIYNASDLLRTPGAIV